MFAKGDQIRKSSFFLHSYFHFVITLYSSLCPLIYPSLAFSVPWICQSYPRLRAFALTVPFAWNSLPSISSCFVAEQLPKQLSLITLAEVVPKVVLCCIALFIILKHLSVSEIAYLQSIHHQSIHPSIHPLSPPLECEPLECRTTLSCVSCIPGSGSGPL